MARSAQAETVGHKNVLGSAGKIPARSNLADQIGWQRAQMVPK